MDGTRGIIAHQVLIKNLIVDFYSELKKNLEFLTCWIKIIKNLEMRQFFDNVNLLKIAMFFRFNSDQYFLGILEGNMLKHIIPPSQ